MFGRAMLVLAVGVLAARLPIALAGNTQSFDRDWRFSCDRDNVDGMIVSKPADPVTPDNPKFDDSAWRKLDVPHDWVIEDLPEIGADPAAAIKLVPGKWQFTFGDDLAWKSPQFDDSRWQTVELPLWWSKQTGKMPGPHTRGWYRRHFTVPATLRGNNILLEIGKVATIDETFVNGVKVGGLGRLETFREAWPVARRYVVPARLLKYDGTDVVAVRVCSGGGDGGIPYEASPWRRGGPFDFDSITGMQSGYTLGGIGWYRKTFKLSSSLQGQIVAIRFDGVYQNATVWLNGHELGMHPNGYTGFHFDLTPFLNFGNQPNVLSVKVDASGHTARWYAGAGIYRHVWLTTAAPTHIKPRGVFVTTPAVSTNFATVRVRTEVENRSATDQPLTLLTRVLDAQGRPVGSASTNQLVAARAAGDFEQAITVNQPQLWSLENPTLYKLSSAVLVEGKVVDEVLTPFGVRRITIDAEQGFVLNGQPLKLRGGAMHSDLGCLGVAVYDRAEERRVALVKASGFNFIRTAHNPPSPEFIDACDRLGMLVLVEAFDYWGAGKTWADYSKFFNDWWQRDIESMVTRDRNHPSVVMWSIGNEVPGQGDAYGEKWAGILADEVRRLDPTRPVTMAMLPQGLDRIEPMLKRLDVAGYNYAYNCFAEEAPKHPGRVFLETESFTHDFADIWMTVLKHPFVLGDVAWTAQDRVGETEVGYTKLPWSNFSLSYCGDLDLDGFPKPAAYYRQAVWGLGQKISAFAVALRDDGQNDAVSCNPWGWLDERPSWTWPGREGKPVTVHVYSHYPKAKLLLNGTDLGTKEIDANTKFTGTWAVPYAPGELVAVGLDDTGKETERWTLRTAGTNSAIRLTPDRVTLRRNTRDLSYVTVEMVDAQGLRQPNSYDLVQFAITGPGKIIAVSNGDPEGIESFQQPRRKAFQGRCLVVVEAGNAGAITLTARVDGLPAASTNLKSQ